MTGAEAPRGVYQHLFSNQATEQPSTPNSKASPSSPSAPCPSPLLSHQTTPHRPRSSAHCTLSCPSNQPYEAAQVRPVSEHPISVCQSHPNRLSFVVLKNGPINIHLNEHIHRAVSCSQNYASRAAECNQCRTHTSSLLPESWRLQFCSTFNFVKSFASRSPSYIS
jgi:hypothetical protein